MQSSESKKSLTQLIESQAAETDLISAVKQRIDGYDGAENAREDLNQIGEARGNQAFAQGGILKRIRDEGWYKMYDFPFFDRFLDEQGIARSTGYAHILLYERITNSGVSWADVKSVGWTKVRYLAEQLTKANREAWIKLASEHTVVELRQLLEKQDPDAIAALGAKVSTQVDTSGAELFPVPKESSQKHRFSIPLHEDQWETVETALKIAKTQTESPYDNVALEMICLSFLAEVHKEFGDSHFFRVAVKRAGHEKLIQLIRDIWPSLDVTVTDTGPSTP
jgi:hypothetical protein